MDCLSAHKQVKFIRNKTRMLTVALSQGQFELLTMGQGVCNSGSTWYRCSGKVLKDRPAEKGVDDLILQEPGSTRIVYDLRKVLEASREGGFIYSKKK